MKRYIKYLVLAIGIVFISFSITFAQQGKKSLDHKLGDILGHNINLQQVEYNFIQHPGMHSFGNLSYIAQTGNQNIADINQVKANNSNRGNVASIVQYFHSNSANISQSGNKNSSSIGQAGVGNSAATKVNGNNNYTVINQYGNGNSATQNITGNSKIFLLDQIGNDNTFYQTSKNEGVRGYKIIQRGSGMHLKILNGRF